MQKVMEALNDGIWSGGTNAIILSLLLRDQQILIYSYMITMGCLMSLQFVNRMIPPSRTQTTGDEHET